MTKTELTQPAVSHQRTSRTVARDQPYGQGSLAAWGVASLSARREQVAWVWSMTRAERITAYVRGELTRDQIQEWTGRAPRELPLINGEFAHIAATTPEACFRCPVCGDDEVALASGGVLSRHTDRRSRHKPSALDNTNPGLCRGTGTHPANANGVLR